METKIMTFSKIEEAIEDFRQGKFVIVVDDEDRENEGDFITPAEMITPEKVNFMLREGRGVLPQEFLQLIVLRLYRPFPTLCPLPRHLADLAISIRCMHKTMVCCGVRDIRKLLSIWHVWQDCSLQQR